MHFSTVFEGSWQNRVFCPDLSHDAMSLKLFYSSQNNENENVFNEAFESPLNKSLRHWVSTGKKQNKSSTHKKHDS